MNFFFLLVTILFSTATQAQKENRLKHFNIEKNNVAVEGYDVVAYFTQYKAIMGNLQFSASVDGVIYYFSSMANKELFLKDTKYYEPQYGGWCAYAMGVNGEKVTINPKTFKIVDDKLYLFYNANLVNTLKKWNKEEGKLKAKADVAWSTIYK